MTIRLTESSGIDMRLLRFLCLLLFAVTLLAGCGSRFEATKTGYTDTKTGRHYTALASTFEAAAGGETVGEYEDETYGRVVELRVIPEADATRFLTDGYGFVYCADENAPDASAWHVSAILVCEEDAISVEKNRLTDEGVIAQIKTLWFEGEEGERPMVKAKHVRRLKLVSADCPGVYYCFHYYVYEDGTACFYDSESRRTVTLPAELIDAIPII